MFDFQALIGSEIFSGKLTRDDDMVMAVNKKISNELKSFTSKDNVFFIDREVLYGGKLNNDYTKNGLPYTYDNGHLNTHGSLSFAENLKSSDVFLEFKQLLNQAP